MEIAAEIEDMETRALALSELGVSYTFTNNLIEAKRNYLESYRLFQITGNFLRISLISNNLGKIFLNMFDYSSAIKYFEEGLQAAGTNKRSRILNLLGLGDAYSNLSNYSRALNY